MDSLLRARGLAAWKVLVGVTGFGGLLAVGGGAAAGELPRPVRVPPEVLAHIEDDDPCPLPRGLAPGEEVPVGLEAHAPLAPPTGAIHTPAEYDGNRGILIRWGTFNSVLTDMAVAVTTGTTAGRVWIVVSGATQQQSATQTLLNAGANLSRVHFLVAQTNSVWIRDYGPRFITVDGVLASVDHVYNRPRPLDDAIPDAVAAAWGHADYDLPLVHGGGNFHLFGDRPAYMTELVLNENSSLSSTDVANLFLDYQNLLLEITQAFPASYDSTQHIDMWMLPAGRRRVILGQYSQAAGGGVPYQVTEAAATAFAQAGYTVYRTPGWRSGGTHYTYTNAVILNEVVLVPQYQSYPAENQTALQVFAQAFPGRTIVPIAADAVVTSAGVLHCIVMHVPDPGYLFADNFEVGTTESWTAQLP